MKKILFFLTLAIPLLAVNMNSMINGTWESKICKKFDDGSKGELIYKFEDGKFETFVRYYDESDCNGKAIIKKKEAGNYNVTAGTEGALNVAITYSRRNKIDLLQVTVGNGSLRITDASGDETFVQSAVNE